MTTPDADGLDQFYTVKGQVVDVSAPAPAGAVLPCCYPLSNGHGAVATTRFLPEVEQGVERPSFVVWQNGVESSELPGLPVAWDAAGDKLEILHPTVGNFEPRGWTEVLAWPDLTSLYATDPQSTEGGGDFDPTGQYLAGIDVNPTSSDTWQMAAKVTNLGSGSVATIPIQGDPTKPGGGYVWNDQGQVVTIGQSDRTMSTYSPDGKLLSQMPAPPGVALVASTNGQTTVRYGLDQNDNPSDIRILKGETWLPVPVPTGELTNIFLSPDGGQLVVTIRSDGGETAYVADIPW